MLIDHPEHHDNEVFMSVSAPALPPINAILWSPGTVQGPGGMLHSPLRIAAIEEGSVRVAEVDMATNRPAGGKLNWSTVDAGDARVTAAVADLRQAVALLQTNPPGAPTTAWTGTVPAVGFGRGADRPMYVEGEASAALLDARTAAAAIFDVLRPAS